MPYKLISLVFLLSFLIINKAYSENDFILPLKKPSVFKKIDYNFDIKKITDLPQKKPIIKEAKPDKIIVKEEKNILTTKKNIKKETVKTRNIFIYPQKNQLHTRYPLKK